MVSTVDSIPTFLRGRFLGEGVAVKFLLELLPFQILLDFVSFFLFDECACLTAAKVDQLGHLICFFAAISTDRILLNSLLASREHLTELFSLESTVLVQAGHVCTFIELRNASRKLLPTNSPIVRLLTTP